MKYARIVDEVVAETVDVEIGKDIFEYFVPALASQFISCPDEVESGWKYNGEEFTPNGYGSEGLTIQETEETPAE
jgi:hypothetical protein